jgi:5-enolpyruvylshikimate-3-phosphate synthase
MSTNANPSGENVVRGFVRATAPLGGTVDVPGSKSLSNRALVCAALADGASRLVGVADGDDTRAMIAALRRMGADITVDGNVVLVNRGIDRRTTDPVHVDARLAGTTARFLVTLAMLRAGETTIDGDEPLRRRPMDGLAVAGDAMGARLEWLERHARSDSGAGFRHDACRRVESVRVGAPARSRGRRARHRRTGRR